MRWGKGSNEVLCCTRSVTEALETHFRISFVHLPYHPFWKGPLVYVWHRHLEAAAHGSARVGEGGDFRGADRAVAVRVEGMVNLNRQRPRRDAITYHTRYLGKRYMGLHK